VERLLPRRRLLSASTATALLGFLEMIWALNRQTLHDRIAATVALRVR